MSTGEAELVKARAKGLAREDRELKAALLRIRQEAGLTHDDLACIMGVTQQAVDELERYDSDPEVSMLRRYANAVGAVYEHHVYPNPGLPTRLVKRDE